MRKLTAIINCRTSSTRLPNKHFKKIGSKFLIEIIIDQFLKINFIDEIYIATGSKKKNFIYEKLLKKKYKKKLKFFYHDKEEFVNERIYFLSKKVKNDLILIFSGDCPIVEKNFIEKIFYLFKKKKNFDYVSLENCILEGMDIFRRSLWKKIYVLSKKGKDLRENPAYIIKLKPNLFKKYKLNKREFSKYINKNKIRASIDTQSDLDFFNLFYEKIRSYNNFNYSNLYKYSEIRKLNRHVNQKNITKKKLKNKKILIITHKSTKFGYGHLSRSQTVFREITETISLPPKLICFSYTDIKKLKKINKYKNLKKIKNYKIIIDVPEKFIKAFLFLKNFNSILVIDNIVKIKNVLSYLPSFKKFNNKNILSGKSCLILNRKIELENLRQHKLNEEIVVFSGSTLLPPKQIINFARINKEIKFHFIISKDTPKTFKRYLQKNNYKFSVSPENFFEIVSKAKAVITRFGVFVLECIKMNKKVFVWDYSETIERLNDIHQIEKERYIKIFDDQNFKNSVKNFNPKKNTLEVGCQKLVSIIKNYET